MAFARKRSFFLVFVQIWQVRCQKKRNDLYSSHIKFRDQMMVNKAIVTQYVLPTLCQIGRISLIFSNLKLVKDKMFAWNMHHIINKHKIQ